MRFLRDHFDDIFFSACLGIVIVVLCIASATAQTAPPAPHPPMKVEGTYENNLDGTNTLYVDAGPCGSLKFVEAHNKDGAVIHRGCWVLYNETSVIIMWIGNRAPATAFSMGAITWTDKPAAEEDATPTTQSKDAT